MKKNKHKKILTSFRLREDLLNAAKKDEANLSMLFEMWISQWIMGKRTCPCCDQVMKDPDMFIDEDEIKNWAHLIPKIKAKKNK